MNLSAGSIKANASNTNPSASVGIAQGWLDSLVCPGQYNGYMPELVSLSSSSKQDVIVEIVPEPATLLLVVVGAAGALLKRKI